ncbi:DUF397 domain-containing protein [Saccharopolyspora terrae]|uniref:DUF397 domain-containing protein n=1 Tax=Saccharopolyspora terrae TaxID=2530384 RepID=A0A4R4VJM9_9PSEU|nr:DUF397 domain-containing protein [Saccharopolyspora terrae]TDD05752.1 DUF397 domain-containing protein [Saccharopolyspora terrae]
MNELAGAVWRKSSRSTDQGQCVELAQNLPHVSGVRDSKAPEQAALAFSKKRFADFLSAVKAGELDG